MSVDVAWNVRLRSGERMGRQSSNDCITLRYSTTGCLGAVLFTMYGDMLGITLWSAVKNWPWGPVLLSQSSSELNGSAERRLWILQSGRHSSNRTGPPDAGREIRAGSWPEAIRSERRSVRRRHAARRTQIVGRRYRPRQLSQVRLTPPLTHEDANSLKRAACSQPANGRSFRRALDISRRRGRRAR
jgi:hypothetical protein